MKNIQMYIKTMILIQIRQDNLGECEITKYVQETEHNTKK